MIRHLMTDNITVYRRVITQDSGFANKETFELVGEYAVNVQFVRENFGEDKGSSLVSTNKRILIFANPDVKIESGSEIVWLGNRYRVKSIDDTLRRGFIGHVEYYAELISGK